MNETSDITICLGAGGVGKTTVSAALGVAHARAGKRAVVLTIDPARRLLESLGLAAEGANSGHDVLRVAGDWEGELWATMLDPDETFRRIINQQASSGEQAQRILTNRIFKNLATSLSGTNEYMAVERLHQLCSDDRFDHVIVDTPPARHAFDFLDSPQRLTRFLDHQLYRTVFAPKKGLLRTLNVAAQRLLRTLGGVVGSELVTDVVDFFADFEGLDRGFSLRAGSMDKLLASPSCRYVVVTAPKAEALRESQSILQSLAQREMTVSTLVANRTTPILLNNDSERWAASQTDPLQTNFASLYMQAKTEVDAITDALKSTHQEPAIDLRTIPEQAKPVYDIDSLIEISKRLPGL